jgi:hypothetical protein
MVFHFVERLARNFPFSLQPYEKSTDPYRGGTLLLRLARGCHPDTGRAAA